MPRCRARPCLVLLLAVFGALLCAAAEAAPIVHDYVPGTIATIFSTECNRYFDWQSQGLVYSARKVKQEGPITRLMACNTANYSTNVDVDTHTHPNWAVHPITGDRYSPYNKPASIVSWLEHAKPTAEYVVILDADMIIRSPMTVELLGASRGRPVSAHYGYLKGVFKENYMKVKERVPNVENAQQVGGFSVMHIEDLRKVAPLWLKWTEEVRADPESWGNTGDIFNANGKAGPPWIAEMYGYVFACAEVGLNFTVSDKFMLYPGYSPPAPDPWPVVLHYGITYSLGDFAFDKHWYMASDLTSCPSKLFQRPPTLKLLAPQPGSPEERRMAVALDCAWGLYDALRDHAITACGISDPPDPPQVKYKCEPNAAGVVLCSQVPAAAVVNVVIPALSASPPSTAEAGALLRGGGGGGDGSAAKERRSVADGGGGGGGGGGDAGAAKGGAHPPLFLAPQSIDLHPGGDGGDGGGGGGGGGANAEKSGAVDAEHFDPALATQAATPKRVIKPHVAGKGRAAVVSNAVVAAAERAAHRAAAAAKSAKQMLLHPHHARDGARDGVEGVVVAAAGVGRGGGGGRGEERGATKGGDGGGAAKEGGGGDGADGYWSRDHRDGSGGEGEGGGGGGEGERKEGGEGAGGATDDGPSALSALAWYAATCAVVGLLCARARLRRSSSKRGGAARAASRQPPGLPHHTAASAVAAWGGGGGAAAPAADTRKGV